jgi:hypothetical protein
VDGLSCQQRCKHACDAEIEPDETVALTLAAGTGYSIGTSAAVVGTILNDDVPAPLYITISTVCSLVFQKAIATNHYSVLSDGLIKPITVQGTPVFDGIHPGWQTLAAATINGENMLLWRHTAANRLHTWTTDANWNWQSAQGWIDPNSNDGYTLESHFGIDLNRDSIIGQPPNTI